MKIFSPLSHNAGNRRCVRPSVTRDANKSTRSTPVAPFTQDDYPNSDFYSYLP